MIENTQPKTTGKLLTDEMIDKRLSFVVVFQFFLQTVNYCSKEILGISDVSIRQLMSVCFMLIAGVIFLWNCKYVLRRRPLFTLSVFGVCIVLYLGSLLFHPETMGYIVEKAASTLLLCLPLFCFIYSINDLSHLYRIFYQWSFIGVALTCITFLTLQIKGTARTYDMVLSYTTLTYLMFIVNALFIKVRVADLIFTIFGSLVILLGGARGPLLCLGALVILSLFFNVQKTQWYKKLIGIVGIGAVLFCATNDRILEAINTYLQQLGITSRTLLKLLHNNFLLSVERKEVGADFFSLIAERPFTGYGLAAETAYIDAFPHNILIEIAFNFGVILAGLAIAGLAVLFVFSVWNKDTSVRYLSLIFFCGGLISLLVSGSYLENQSLWIFLAVCLAGVRNKGKKEQSHEYLIRNKFMDRSV